MCRRDGVCRGRRQTSSQAKSANSRFPCHPHYQVEWPRTRIKSQTINHNGEYRRDCQFQPGAWLCKHLILVGDLYIFPSRVAYPRAVKGILQNLYRLQMLDLNGAKSSQMAALRAGIPDGILASYDRQRARRKKGIAIVRNHVCGNCRMKVPLWITASLMTGAVQSCGNCGTYLCLPDPAEEAAAAPTPEREKPKRRRAKRAPAG